LLREWRSPPLLSWLFPSDRYFEMRDRLVILAAGGGTRLRQARLGSTKPTTEVGGVPMIVRVLVGARRIGVTRADIVIGYRGEEIKEALSSQ
jgi:NDP-sugar pyrophosphorylase family protein